MRTQLSFILSSILLSGCGDSLKEQETENSVTETIINVSVTVPEQLQTAFANATVTARYPESETIYTSTMDSMAMATFSVTASDTSDPLAITVAQGTQVLKGLSSTTSVMVAQQARASQSTTAVTITPESTAQFAYLDQNADGQLSAEEMTDQTIKMAQAQANGLFYIAAAMEIYAINGSVEGTQSQSSYRLALDMFRSENLTNLVKVSNQSAIKAIMDRDYPSEVSVGDPNPESDDFFRIDQAGNLLASQSGDYADLPWRCVDDLRSRSRPLRNYGYGINVWHYPAAVTANDLVAWSEVASNIQSLNNQVMCNVDNWSVPTVEELQSIIEDNQVQYPLSFPFMNARYYWVNRDNSRSTVDAVIFDATSGTVTTDTSLDRAAVIYKSFTRVDKDRLQRQTDQTRDEISQAYAEVNALYASRDPATWPAPDVDSGVSWEPLGELPAVEYPSDNPYSLAAYNLGKRLFFDARLSQNKDISCSTCHAPAQGWDDNLTVSVGHDGQKGTRNAPSIINAAFQHTLFWDGRADSLEEQALQPIANPVEMNLSLEELEARIHQGDFADYQDAVGAAFGRDQLTTELIARSLATFQRSVLSRDTKFDRFLRDEANLTNRELWGLHLFRTKAKCMNCHSGPNFTNNEFEDIGLSDYGRRSQDLGRYSVTLAAEDSGKFKVASLRELLHTAPYMHTGRFDLEEAVTAYNNAMGVNIVSSKLKINEHRYDPLFPQGSDKLHVLSLTASEITAIVDFLETLSSDEPPLVN